MESKSGPSPASPPAGQVSYTEESKSGFRYRLLDITVDEGYAAAAALLLPNEKLYRMMDGEHRVGGKLFPILMNDPVNFAQSVAAISTRGWRFYLAAGIPLSQYPDPEALEVLPLGRAIRAAASSETKLG